MNKQKRTAAWILSLMFVGCAGAGFAAANLDGGYFPNAQTAYAEEQAEDARNPREWFRDWANGGESTVTYGKTDKGVWRKDAAAGAFNRQVPIAKNLVLGEEKDATITFALPVYDGEGNLLADKTTTETIMVLSNEQGKELQIKFLPADENHKNGINFCVSKVGDNWTSYWTGTRIPGDFTADNFISLKFSRTENENIMFKDADGKWVADASVNNHDDLKEFVKNSSSLSVNFMYWAENSSANTNLEVVLQEFDGTDLTQKKTEYPVIPNEPMTPPAVTVEESNPENWFKDWANGGADTVEYGVNENGVWRKDAGIGSFNRQNPLKKTLTIEEGKDAYFTFAIPVYDKEGNLLPDKGTEEILLAFTNEAGKEFMLKFLPADDKHADGINFCVAKNGSDWVNYWTTKRMPGDFTADNFISVKLSKTAGKSIMFGNEKGEWYADPGINNHKDVIEFFQSSGTFDVNFSYWAENCKENTNFELILRDFNGTKIRSEIIPGKIEFETDPVLAVFAGKTYTLPAAKGLFGEHEEEVSITVKDSDGGEVALENGGFITAAGEYMIRYTAVFNGETATKEYKLRVYSSDKQMDVPQGDLTKEYFRNWISGPCEWTDKGLVSKDNNGTVSAYQRQSYYTADYTLDDGNDLTMTVSIPIYDSDGNKLPDRLNHAEDKIDNLDLMIIDIDTDREFRIRLVDTYSAKEETSFFGAYMSKDPYATEGNNWITRPADTKMKGTFTEDSSFTFRFTGRENEHFQVIAPDGTWKSVGDGEGADEAHSLTKALNTFFATAKNIRVGFYYWATPEVATEEDNLCVIYKEINGQSFIPCEGKIIDEIAPIVGGVVLPKNSEFKTGSDYVFNVKYVSEIFEDTSARKLVYRKKGETEWKETGRYDADSGKIVGCRFDVSGTIEVAVFAEDGCGNVGYGEATEITVTKGYDITVSGEVPSSGKVGAKITLPAATANDKNGETREVVISVEDSAGRTVTMDSADSFTPTKAGTYYVIYKSSYEEGGKTVSAKKEFTVLVSEGGQTSSSGNSGNASRGCGSVVGGALSGVTAILGAALALAKKKRR